MKIDDAARAINRYLVSVANTFGTQSAEYHSAEKLVTKDIIYGNPNLVRRTESGVLQIKRGKALQQANINPNFQTKLEKVRTKQKKKKNTVKEMKRKYEESFKKEHKKKPTKKEIRDLAEHEFNIKNEADNFYEEHLEVIHDNSDLLQLWQDAGKNATWKAGEINPFYERAVQATKAYEEEDYDLFNQILKEREAEFVDLSEFGG